MNSAIANEFRGAQWNEIAAIIEQWSNKGKESSSSRWAESQPCRWLQLEN